MTELKKTLPIEPLMRPRSLAIIGMSSKEGGPSRAVLKNLQRNGYDGDIYLVGKGGFDVDGIPCLAGISEMPEGVDLAVLVLGADAVEETLRQLVAKKVRAAICFASGFAETGEAGRETQERIGQIAKEGGISLIGPNSVGYTNYLDGFSVMLVAMGRVPAVDPSAGPCIAIIAQSGGIGAHLSASLMARGVPISYLMTTGNEAAMGLADLGEFYVDDARTGAILIYAEQVRNPAAILGAATKAQAVGKPVVLLHPGKSETAQKAAASHTGALAGDYQAMRVTLEASGILVADTLEEAVDLAEAALRVPLPGAGGLGLVAASGALCALAQDYAEQVGITIPPMSEEQVTALTSHLPSFTPPRNPLDLGTLLVWQPELVGLSVKAMLDDPGIGSVLVSFPYGEALVSVPWIKQIVTSTKDTVKPVIYCVHDEGVELPAEVKKIARENRVILARSPERALRTLAALHRAADRKRLHERAHDTPELPRLDLPEAKGALTEVEGKALLDAIGIHVPSGGLVNSAEAAVQMAESLGYPVVMKIQSPDILHKSDIGGVILNLSSADAVRAAWTRMMANVTEKAASARIQGVLIEAMSARGTELVIGASRDANWGPSVMIGLGGVWIEALADVRLLPASAQPEEFKAALQSLRGAKLLKGFRGAAPVDIDAVAHTASRIGALMLARPDIVEIDLNPVIANERGCLALDALIVRAD